MVLQDEADRVSATHGVETAYFFQPDALVDETQLQGYEEITNLTAAELMGSPLAVALEAATDRSATGRRTSSCVRRAGPARVRGLVPPERAGARLTAEAMSGTWSRGLRRLVR